MSSLKKPKKKINNLYMFVLQNTNRHIVIVPLLVTKSLLCLTLVLLHTVESLSHSDEKESRE